YPIVWNGGFELVIVKDAGPFDWSIGRNEYARFTVDTANSRTGSRSLRVDFAGRDTTRLNGELRQMIVVRPGARYLLEYYVKADGFVSPEGPRIAVTSDSTPGYLGITDPIAAGSYEWRRLAVSFVAPPLDGGQDAADSKLAGLSGLHSGSHERAGST